MAGRRAYNLLVGYSENKSIDKIKKIYIIYTGKAMDDNLSPSTILSLALEKLWELLDSNDDDTKLKAIEISLKYLVKQKEVSVVDEVEEGK